MKLFKRALSALLSLNMVITLLPFNIANATEPNNANGSYTVTLLTSENGSASFTEESKTASTASQTGFQLVTVNEKGELVPIENDGSVWAFSAGDTVEIVLTPKEGYSVKSFAIKDADNNVLGSEETTNNVFSFTMANKNLTIESNFEKTDSSNTPSGEEPSADSNLNASQNLVEAGVIDEELAELLGEYGIDATEIDQSELFALLQEYGISTYATGDPGENPDPYNPEQHYTSGKYWATKIWSIYDPPYYRGSRKYIGKVDGPNGPEDADFYCAQASIPGYTVGQTKSFSNGVELTDERIRKVLFYTNPEWSQGMCYTACNVKNPANEWQNYFYVHYMLTELYSPGNASKKMNQTRAIWRPMLDAILALPNVLDSGIDGCEDFHAYMTAGGNMQDMIYAMKGEPAPSPPADPLTLKLGKAGNKMAPEMSEATLDGAIIRVHIYSEEECNPLPTTAQEARATKAQAELEFATKLAEINGEIVGEIDFAPRPDGSGGNDYLTSDNYQDIYDQWWGVPGVYWIYEEKSSKGYLNSGTMGVAGSDYMTNNVKEIGVLIKVELADDWEALVNAGEYPWKLTVNGEEVNNSEIDVENILSDYNVQLYENEGTPLLESWAEWEDTNTQWTLPHEDLKPIDHIHIYDIMANNHVEVKTYLYYLDDLQGLDEETLKDPEKIAGAGVKPIICKCGGSNIVSNVNEGKYSCNGDHHSFSWLNLAEWADHDFETEFQIDTSVLGQTPSDLAGRDLVFMNYVYMPEMHEDGSVPANWSLVTDTSEQLHFPNGGTVCIGDFTGDHIVHAWTGQEVHETIYYENLRPNSEFVVKAYLMDKATNDYARDAYGTPIQNTQNTQLQISSPTGSGSWIVDFKFDAQFYEQSKLSSYYHDEINGRYGREYVAYVEVYQGSELVWEHKVFDDKEESFYIPHISTELLDSNTKDHVSFADGSVTLIDTVTYDHMLPGRTYHIHGELIDMDTGEVAKDVNGNPITADRYHVTPDGTEGEWTIEYNFDGRNLSGHVCVSYIYVYLENSNGSEQPEAWVAHHTDFWDRAQRMYFPYIDTYANDVKTGALIRGETNANANHNAFAEDEMVIQDLVRYEAVMPVTYYTMVSELHYALDTPDGLHKKGDIVVDDNGKVMHMRTVFFADMWDDGDEQWYFDGWVQPNDEDRDEEDPGQGRILFQFNGDSHAGYTYVIKEYPPLYHKWGFYFTYDAFPTFSTI